MAITLQDHANGSAGGGPPPSVAFNTAVSIGDVLIGVVHSESGSSPGTVTVSDNVNSGNYSPLNSYLDSGTSSWIGIFFKVANASGTPTVSVAESNNLFGKMNILRFNGFVGTPTADATMDATGPFTGATTAVSCSPITTNFNIELLITGNVRSSGSYTSANITGWTAFDGATFGSDVYYAVEATSGTTNNFAGTLGSAGAWQSVFAGIYDAGGGATGTATIAWIT